MFISEQFINEIAVRAGDIDGLAHDAASSPHNDHPEPSDTQKKSGNYKMGHLSFQGLPISIENPKGSTRSGQDRDGNTWSNKIHQHYGYIKGTMARDKDHIDCFIGDQHNSDKVFVINQNNPKDGKFDEHKIMFAFLTHSDAVKGYLKNYDNDWEQKGGIGSVYGTDMKTFKNWIKNGNTKVPFKGV